MHMVKHLENSEGHKIGLEGGLQIAQNLYHQHLLKWKDALMTLKSFYTHKMNFRH